VELKMSLKAARINANKKQSEAAEHLGVCIDTIKNWESGKSMIRADQFQRLCSFYGVPGDAIFLPSRYTES